MFREREDIIDTLENARRLLEERPELLGMDKEEILDVLDDGSREMIGYRWGVVAYAYVRELTDFALPAIIEAFSGIKSGILTYEYIGFILQSEHDINLVDLLLVANNMNLYDKILPFVEQNVVFEKTFAPEKIDAFLDAYYVNDSKKNHLQLLRYYSKLIVNFNSEGYLCQKVLDTQDNKYYDLMLHVCNDLYEKDYKLADEFMENFLKEEVEICKKLAIEFVYRSLRNHCEAFEAHYASWENYVKESEELWKMLIPAYTTYVQNYSTGAVYELALCKLKTISEGSIGEKRAFISQIQYNDEIISEIENILSEMLKESFEKDRQILDALDWIFYKKLTQGKLQEVLEKMQLIFSVNGYKHDWNDFFEAFDSTHSELKKKQAYILEEAFHKISKGNESEFYFAVGLCSECIVWKDVRKNLEGKNYSEDVVELVMLGLLYNMLIAKSVCLIAFQLAGILDDKLERYLEVCEKEIYTNYPYTMNDYANQYISSENEKIRKLALKIVQVHKKRLEHVESGADILDLRPSARRLEAYRRAEWEHKKRVNQMSDERSVFAGLFSKNVMKYGKRNAFIQVGRHNEWTFQVSNYAEVSYELELPQAFMKDQLLLSEKRYEYMERRKQYAINH